VQENHAFIPNKLNFPNKFYRPNGNSVIRPGPRIRNFTIQNPGIGKLPAGLQSLIAQHFKHHFKRDFDRPNTFAVRFSLVQFGSLWVHHDSQQYGITIGPIHNNAYGISVAPYLCDGDFSASLLLSLLIFKNHSSRRSARLYYVLYYFFAAKNVHSYESTICLQCNSDQCI